MKIILRLLYYIGIILLFMPGFVLFIIPNTAAFFPYAVIPAGMLFLLCFILNPNKFNLFIKRIFSLKTTKYYLYFLGVVILTTLGHKLLGYNKAPQSYYILRYIQFFVYFILLYFFSPLAIYLRIPIRKIIRLIYSVIFIIFVIGIIQYIALILNMNSVISFIANFNNVRNTDLMEAFNQSAISQLRVNSIFQEPSAFGKFIFMIMPIIMISSKSKQRIFSIKLCDILYKKLIILLMLLNIVFTKSPIYLILCLIEFVILFIILNIHTLKKYSFKIVFVGILLLMMFSIIIVNQYDNIYIEQTYLYRIIITFKNITSFDNLVIAEPSLATRLIYYINALQVFKSNFLWGCGLFNVNVVWNYTFLQNNLPMTQEAFFNYLRIPYAVSGGANFTSTLLAETGVIGTSLYFMHIVKIIQILRKIYRTFQKTESDFCKGIYMSIIGLIIVSCYNLSYDFTCIPLLLGVAVLFLMKEPVRQSLKKLERSV